MIDEKSGIELKEIPAGKFTMGATTCEGHPLDKELPQVELEMSAYSIATTTVTNAQFKKFVEATGYETTAEKYGASFVFYKLIYENSDVLYKDVPQTPWWLYVKDASWKHPYGPGSDIEDIMDHPVVHVSYMDALAFCDWADLRLPSEAEWEYAARAGSEYRWPWGSEFTPNGECMANTWQGDFPYTNTLDDGFLGTCPVKSFQPNDFGLYNVIGNVWEWCNNPRGIDLSEFKDKDFISRAPFNIEDIPEEAQIATKGGSFLCHSSYCNRYRLGARNGNTAFSSSSNVGFRVCK